MKIFIFPAQAPDLNFVLAEDGMMLAMCGNDEVERKAKLYRDSFTVEFVVDPWRHAGVQLAVHNNKLRAKFSKDGTQMGRVELFRWQHGRLPVEGETCPLDVRAGVRSMVIGIVNGKVTWESIAVVMHYLLSLVPEQEETQIER